MTILSDLKSIGRLVAETSYHREPPFPGRDTLVRMLQKSNITNSSGSAGQLGN